MATARFQRGLFLAVLCVAVDAPTGWAADSSDERSYFNEFPVVLSPSRLLQPLSDAPSAMTVIDREMIAASGFRKIPDLFKLVPGMYVSYYGSKAIVSYHGISDQYARRMLVLVDGRSIYLPPFSDVDWESLPLILDDIYRIEVIRGPSAAAHGANSLQGVINIITHDAGMNIGMNAGTSVSTTRGEPGVADVSAQAARRGEKLDYRLTMGYRSDDGYNPRLDLPINDNRSYDSAVMRLANFRANYHPNQTDSFDVKLGASSGVRGVGFTDARLNQPHDLHSTENFQQVTWQRAMAGSNELQLRYYHIRLNKKEETLTKVLPIPPVPMQYQLADQLITDRNELELQHTVQLRDDNRLVWGAAYRSDYFKAEHYFLNPLWLHDYRLFAHSEWRITPAWLLNTGLMLEKDDISGTRSSPQLALNYHVTPQHTLRASVSKAYRNPAAIEEKGDWRYQLGGFTVQIIKASGGLRPERVVSREIGYLGNMAEYGASVDLRVFHDRYSDIIVPSALYGFANTSTPVEQSGAETSIEYRVAAHSRVIFNYSRNLISTDLTGYSGNMPEEQFSLMYLQYFRDNTFSINHYKQSAALPADRGYGDLQAQHQRTDLRLAKPLKGAGGISGEVALVIQNLFDETYTEYISTNVFNRRGYAKLTIHF